jgi:hypothetical protein
MNPLSIISSLLDSQMREQPAIKVLTGAGEVLISSVSLLALLSSKKLSPWKIATGVITAVSFVDGVIKVAKGLDELDDVSDNQLYDRATP